MSSPSPLVVVAVGGNALQTGSGRDDLKTQWSAARAAAVHLADLAATGLRLVVTHGNGPQVGHELRRAELAEEEAPRLSMDVAVAHTQGGIGYMLAVAIDDALRAQGVDRTAVAVVTRVFVDPGDPAFERPDKPIGRFMPELQAQRLARTRGWRIRHVSERGWRRVVASPRPLRVPELEAIRRLADAGVVVIAGGGGGVPVVAREHGTRGIPAVVDKDLLSSLLARQLGAEALVIATDVERIALDFGTPRQSWIDRLTVDQARELLRDGQFPAGSMGPKVAAAVEFVDETGGRALVTRLDRILEAYEGRAGTELVG